MQFLFCPICTQPLEKNRPSCSACRSCGREFYNNPTPAAGAILLSERDELVISVRKYPPRARTLDVFGGFIEVNETAEEALARELKEETGLTVAHLLYIGSYCDRYTYKKLNYHTLNFTFVARIEPVRMTLSDDVAGFELFPLSRIPYDRLYSPALTALLRSFTMRKEYWISLLHSLSHASSAQPRP